MRERGSAMLTTVVAVMVLLLISGILFSFVNNQFKMQTTEEKSLKAYYLADAGTSYGIACMVEAVKKGNYTDITKDVQNPFGTVYSGEFDVTVTVTFSDPNPNHAYYITAISKGYYPSQGETNHILRTLKKEYAFTMP